MKRHAVVDTLGLVWGLAVTAAGVADCRGARAAVREARAASGDRRAHLWADAAYRGLLAFAWVLLDVTVAVVTRRDGAVGLEAQPRRWVAERAFGWLTRRRRNRSCERTLASSRAVVQVALIGVMARRLAKTNRW